MLQTLTCIANAGGNAEDPTRIPTHEGIRAYQKNYNTIDVADMKMAAWSVERPSKRWYFRLFHYGLNVVVLNVSIIAAF